jgi:hypothetical protein
MPQFYGAARFHDLEYRDEALLDGGLAEQTLDKVFFLGLAFESLKANASLFGFGLCMIHEGLRLLLDEGQEIHAAHLEAAVNPAIQMVVAPKRKISLENDSIMATEDGYNRGGEFLREVRRHGVLLSEGLVTPEIAERRVI